MSRPMLATPDEVIALAGLVGVPAGDEPIVACLTVQPGRDAVGWAATRSQLFERVELGGTSTWPAGDLDVVGARVDGVPDIGPHHPYLVLEDFMTIRVHRAELVIPSKRGSASATWPASAGSAQTRFTTPHTADDTRRVMEALDWLSGDFANAAHRPKGSGTFASGEAFRTEATSAIRLLHKNRKKPTQSRVAEALGLSERRLQQLVAEHVPERWDAFRDAIT